MSHQHKSANESNETTLSKEHNNLLCGFCLPVVAWKETVHLPVVVWCGKRQAGRVSTATTCAEKRNHNDAPAPIPPSPPKLQKTTSESKTNKKKDVTPTARIAAEDAFKPFKTIEPVNLMGAAGPRLYIKTVANGLFHLIYVQELKGTEAFSHPVIKQLFPNPNQRIGKNTDFVHRPGIIAVAPRYHAESPSTGDKLAPSNAPIPFLSGYNHFHL
jgi:hypothetical protein